VLIAALGCKESYIRAADYGWSRRQPARFASPSPCLGLVLGEDQVGSEARQPQILSGFVSQIDPLFMRYFVRRQRTDGETSELCWNSQGGGVPCRDDPHPTPWTMETVTAGLCGFYREIAGVGLVFPACR
jgi:hypothetical protein